MGTGPAHRVEEKMFGCECGYRRFAFGTPCPVCEVPKLVAEALTVAGTSELEAIVAKLGKKPEDSDGGFKSMQQLVKETGLHQRKIVAMLHVLKDKGLLEIKKVQAETIAGAKYWQTRYRVKPSRKTRGSKE